jgi:hypothetical protein
MPGQFADFPGLWGASNFRNSVLETLVFSEGKQKDVGSCMSLGLYSDSQLTGRVAQVIEQLPSKHEVLSSNPSTQKKKK